MTNYSAAFFSWLILSAFHKVVLYRVYRNAIPNGKNVPDPCFPDDVWKAVGHTTEHGSDQINKFGHHFAMYYDWTLDLCKMDSDGDGLTNGEELGDPNCTWTSGDNDPISQNGRIITHPGICEDVNLPKCRVINHWLTPGNCPTIIEELISIENTIPPTGNLQVDVAPTGWFNVTDTAITNNDTYTSLDSQTATPLGTTENYSSSSNTKPQVSFLTRTENLKNTINADITGSSQELAEKTSTPGFFRTGESIANETSNLKDEKDLLDFTDLEMATPVYQGVNNCPAENPVQINLANTIIKDTVPTEVAGPFLPNNVYIEVRYVQSITFTYVKTDLSFYVDTRELTQVKRWNSVSSGYNGNVTKVLISMQWNPNVPMQHRHLHIEGCFQTDRSEQGNQWRLTAYEDIGK